MDSENKFRILVASDIHLGYNEKDEIRGEDSFRTFVEVLEKAKELKVDMVLLGGDLFHENKPSPSCMTKCTEALRMHCLGAGEVKFKLISDQKENFSHSKSFPYVNFEEPNLNVSMPVFSIHGNHDDPTGKNPVCFLETLSASGLINYFGKYMDMNGINLKPLLLKKGKTHLALYGLGSLPEERLHRLFLHDKIKFLRPTERTERWFNLFVVHQNRAAHGTKYLPENFLTNLPHLVVWGHEHEAIEEPDYNAEMGFQVYQPGSTVCTSLGEGEAKPKQVGLLEIFCDTESGGRENKFKITPIPLKTTRQFIFETINLDKELPGNPKDTEIRDFCSQKVTAMITQARIDHSGSSEQPELPLIRLRVESENPLPFLPSQFGLDFKGKVANPSDIILSKLKRKPKMKDFSNVNLNRLDSATEEAGGGKLSNIVDIVAEYFDEDPSVNLKMLQEKLVTTAVKEMVEKESTSAVSEILDSLIENTREHLMSLHDLSGANMGDVMTRIEEYREEVRKTEDQEMEKLRQRLGNGGNGSGMSKVKSEPRTNDSDDDVMEVMEVSSDDSPPPAKRGRGRGRGGRR